MMMMIIMMIIMMMMMLATLGTGFPSMHFNMTTMRRGAWREVNCCQLSITKLDRHGWT